MHEDDERFREIISARLEELGRSQAWLADEIGRKRGYFTDYLVKRKPKRLSVELRAKTADALKIDRSILKADTPVRSAAPPSVRQPTGFSEDVEPYTPPKGGYLNVLPHVIYYRVKTRALDMATPVPILPGMVLRIDINQSRIEALRPGCIVVAQRMGRTEGLDHKETILRQFLAPDKLVTNSSGHNEIERIDDHARGTMITVRGTVVGWLGDYHDNGEAERSQPQKR